MRPGDRQGLHLTYCSNIHAAEGLAEVQARLFETAGALKARLAPRSPFGVGLRLSAAEVQALLFGHRLDAFRAALDEAGLYVYTLNGFPYGAFHGRRVKSSVFAPDWRSEARVAYTLRLAQVLQALLPEGVEGGISTVPLSYKAWVREDDGEAWHVLTRNVVRVAHGLIRLHEGGGPLIHLDLEPEPDGLLETMADVVEFFRCWLLPVGKGLLAEVLNTSEYEAEAHLLAHVRVCLDACHLAVSYEDPAAALDRLAAEGIRVGKLQLSSALRVALPPAGASRTAIAQALAPFAESTYLHQVIERLPDGALRHYPDLPEALTALATTPGTEWRIHYHVPIGLAEAGGLGTTQGTLQNLLASLGRGLDVGHLEIETYTWDVLPASLKGDLVGAIAAEYDWAIAQLGAPAPQVVR